MPPAPWRLRIVLRSTACGRWLITWSWRRSRRRSRLRSRSGARKWPRRRPRPLRRHQPPPAQEPVQVVAPPPPPPPPPPVAKTVTLPAGTVIPIRMTDTLDSGKTQPNTVFHGSLAGDLILDGMVVASSGAPVTGRVIIAKDATHFSGSSELSIELTRIDTVDHPVDVVTDAYDKQGAGRGKNTAIKTGGGAAVGAILGGILGGGKGAAIGAASGGGLGAGVNGVTKGQQVQIPTETLVSFHLQSPISVTTSKTGGRVARRGRFATTTVTYRLVIGCRWSGTAGPSTALARSG